MQSMSEKSQGLLSQVEAFNASGAAAQAIDACLTAMETNANDHFAKVLLGNILVEHRQLEEATMFLRAAVEAEPDNLDFFLSYANALVISEANDLASILIEKAPLLGAEPEVCAKIIAGEGYEPSWVSSSNSVATKVEVRSARAVASSRRREPKKAVIARLNDLFGAGQFSELLRQLDEMQNKFPKSAVVAHLTAASLLSVGRFSESEQWFERAIEQDPSNHRIMTDFGNMLRDRGQLRRARQLHKRAFKARPSDSFVSACFAHTAFLYGDRDEARSILRSAKKLCRSDAPASLYALGLACLQAAEVSEAADHFKSAIACNPLYAPAYSALARAQTALRDFDEAIITCMSGVKASGQTGDLFDTLATIFLRKKQFLEAIAAHEQSVACEPHRARSHMAFAQTLALIGSSERAMQHLEVARKLDPSSPEIFDTYAAVYEREGKIEEAIAELRKSLEITADNPATFNYLSVLHRALGRLEEAEQALESALLLDPAFPWAHRNLADLRPFSIEDSRFKLIAAALDEPDRSETEKHQLWVTLTKGYEDVGEHSNAFECLSRANKIKKKLTQYTIETDETLLAEFTDAFADVWKDRVERDSDRPVSVPIFIVGMPRSGTTLIEQVLSMHPEVHGAGELPYVESLGMQMARGIGLTRESVSEFRKNYLDAVAAISNGSPFVVDKMPHNFRFIGLIKAAIPEAKIVYMKRDAGAVCWSNFRQPFNASGLDYSNDLSDVVTYYKLFEGMMGFWREQFPAGLIELDYDAFVNDQEKRTSDLLEALGLSFYKDCLEPHNNMGGVRTASNLQVRKRVYKDSSSVWRRYSTELNGAFDSLYS